MSKSSKTPKPPLPVGTHRLALSQARAFAVNAKALCSQLTTPADPATVLAYLVNAGLAVELYFKAFMIAGRGGHFEEGHNLSKLLNDFPPLLRISFNSTYDAHPTAKTAPVKLVALTLSGSTPDKPRHQHTDKYATFDQAISSISRIFVDSRYFFERLATPDWVVITYPTDVISAIFQALEETFQKYESGQLKDQTSTPAEQTLAKTV
jgi:hypothetical protein